MAWCPNCKFEYVDGIKICPDCKTELVDSIEDDVDEITDEEMAQAFRPYVDDEPSEEEKAEIIARIRSIKENPNYKSKEEEYEENRSGASVLLIAGIVGIAVLILNLLGVFNIPLRGFSLVLMYIVMGFLFVVFVISGFLAIRKMKALAPEVKKEKQIIKAMLDYIREKKNDGTYALVKDENYELNYLDLSERVVKDLNEEFLDIEPGFAFYVVDRFANDILDED